MNDARKVLELREVSKGFGNHMALDHISFDVGEGEIVALLGDNGAGKSTLVKCLSGVHSPDDGAILMDGEPVAFHSPEQALRAGIGVVFQDLAMFDNLDVAENLFIGRELRTPRFLGPFGFLRRGAMAEEMRTIIGDLQIGVPNPRSSIGLMSGGQRQAIAVSRGVAFAKRLVILDEPTAALGIRERTNVLRIVKRLPEIGISVLIISHNLEEMIQIADRAVVLRQGKKVGELPATHENHERIVSLIVGGALAPIDGEPHDSTRSSTSTEGAS